LREAEREAVQARKQAAFEAMLTGVMHKRFAEIVRRRIQQAVLIYRYAIELVNLVITRDHDFDDVLAKAQERRDAAISERGQLGRLVP
jgi:hypothetical protein